MTAAHGSVELVLGEDASLQAAGGVDLCAGKVELAARGGISVNVTVRHGEAVALGMALAFRYGAELGVTPAADAGHVANVIEASGLPVSLAGRDRARFTAKRLAELMQQDKKARGGRVPLILARGIGAAYIHPDADLASIEAFLDRELLETA